LTPDAPPPGPAPPGPAAPGTTPPGTGPVPDAPLAGVRVVEVATHVFVPMAGSVLRDWGADVIKVEHPHAGDPYRSLSTFGLHNTWHGIDPFFQAANRGKRSVGIDLTGPQGRELLSRLVAGADVFMTSLRAGARSRLGIDVTDIRRDNPQVIYVRGSAFGPRGPDAGAGGYDAGAYWARSGMQHLFTPPGAAWPARLRPAVGDNAGALAIAGAVGTALYRRAVRGEPSLIDAALLATGLWQVQPDIVNAGLAGDGPGGEQPPAPSREDFWNPLWQTYRTADGRFLVLMMLASDKHWPGLCARLGHPELAADPRFADAPARQRNSRACVTALDSIFSERSLPQWCRALAGFAGEWAPVQTPAEVHADPQVRANGFIAPAEMAGGDWIPLVSPPVQFDQRPSRPSRAPEVGEHTETVLVEMGLTWPQISALKDAGVIT
jgi:crotonobetainyl-CoA:carnitine CoA-transferase CaiB-like acyl-CoA transferase